MLRLPGAGPRSPRLVASTRHELRSHFARDQFELSRLIAERPEVDALASGLRVTSEELDAVLRGTDADLATKVLGVSSQDGGQDIAEHAVGLRSIRGDPGLHRRERGGKAVRLSFASLERTRQGRAGGGEAFRRRVVGGGEPAVTRPGDAGEPGTQASASYPQGYAVLAPGTRRELGIGRHGVVARLLGRRFSVEQCSQHGERLVESLPALIEGAPRSDPWLTVWGPIELALRESSYALGVPPPSGGVECDELAHREPKGTGLQNRRFQVRVLGAPLADVEG